MAIYDDSHSPYSRNAKASSFDKGVTYGALVASGLSVIGLAAAFFFGAIPAALACGAAILSSLATSATALFVSHKKFYDDSQLKQNHISRVSPTFVTIGACVPLVTSIAVGCSTAFWAANKFQAEELAKQPSPYQTSALSADMRVTPKAPAARPTV